MYRVRTVFQGVQGSPWLSTFYFDESSGTAQQAATAAGAFWTGVNTHIFGAITWSTQTDVSLIDAITGDLTGVSTVTAVTGTGAGGTEPLPYATQGLVRWRTGVFRRGRELRGRTFLPGLVEAGSTNGAPSSAVVTAVNAAAATLIAAATAQHMVWQRNIPNPDLEDAPDEEPGFAANSVTGSMSPTWAILRSRRD